MPLPDEYPISPGDVLLGKYRVAMDLERSELRLDKF